MITNPVLRVVDIPLTEASDSPKIAAWHMTPTEVRHCLLFNHSDTTRNEERSKMQTLFNILQEKATRPTVLYLHGVAHTRGYPHRVDLYKVGHEGTTSCYHFMIIMF